MSPGSSERRSRGGAARAGLLRLAAGLPLLVLTLPGLQDVHLQRPLGLVAASALLVLIVLHLIVPDRTPVRVASLALWRVVASQARATPRLRLHPFWRDLLFWLRASIIALLACACASPTLIRRGREPALLLLVDRSATMATRLGRIQPWAPAHRDEQARRTAEELATRFAGPVGLIAFSASERTVRAPTAAPDVIAALKKLEPPSGWGREQLPAMIGQARELLDNYGGELRIVLLSDNVDGNAEHALREGELREPCAAGWCTLLVVGSDTPVSDAAITAAPARVAAGSPVVLQIQNSGTAAVQRRLKLAPEPPQPGQEPVSIPVDLAPGGQAFELPVQLHPGCWRMSFEPERPGEPGDDLQAGDTLTLQVTERPEPTCLVQSTDVLLKDLDLQSLLREAGIEQLGEPLHYDGTAVTQAAVACSQLIFADPAGHEEIFEHPVVRARDWLAIYLATAGGGVVTRRSAEIPPLAEIEPRLLALAPLRAPGLRIPERAAPLIGISGGGLEEAAVVRWPAGTRHHTALALRWATATDPEKAATRSLLALLALFREHRTVGPDQVHDRVPGGMLLQRLCPASAPPGPEAEQGLYVPLHRAALSGGSASEAAAWFLRVTPLDPTLRSVRAQKSGLQGRPLEGGHERALWPLLLALALCWSLLEQIARSRREACA